MTEFEKAATAMKTEAIAEFKKRLVRDISIEFNYIFRSYLYTFIYEINVDLV